jgi:hypothetical protein
MPIYIHGDDHHQRFANEWDLLLMRFVSIVLGLSSLARESPPLAENHHLTGCWVWNHIIVWMLVGLEMLFSSFKGMLEMYVHCTALPGVETSPLQHASRDTHGMGPRWH